MLLDLREIRQPETRVDRVYAVGELATDRDDDYRLTTPLVLRLRVLKDGDKYRLLGGLQGTLELACGRCLEPFPLAVDLAIDLLYLPDSRNQGEGEFEITDEDLSTGFYRDEAIDLDAMVREQCQLALPMKPLCRDDCRGLCVECGTNLNHGTCSCDVRWRDPRLAVLESLRRRDRES